MVETERKGPLGICFEDKFLQYCIENKEESKKYQKKKNYEYEPCCHDLWSNDPSTYDQVSQKAGFTISIIKNLDKMEDFKNGQNNLKHMPNDAKFEADLENEPYGFEIYKA